MEALFDRVGRRSVPREWLDAHLPPPDFCWSTGLTEPEHTAARAALTACEARLDALDGFDEKGDPTVEVGPTGPPSSGGPGPKGAVGVDPDSGTDVPAGVDADLDPVVVCGTCGNPPTAHEPECPEGPDPEGSAA